MNMDMYMDMYGHEYAHVWSWSCMDIAHGHVQYGITLHDHYLALFPSPFTFPLLTPSPLRPKVPAPSPRRASPPAAARGSASLSTTTRAPPTTTAPPPSRHHGQCRQRTASSTTSGWRRPWRNTRTGSRLIIMGWCIIIIGGRWRRGGIRRQSTIGKCFRETRMYSMETK